jgi:hypothetical protein
MKFLARALFPCGVTALFLCVAPAAFAQAATGTAPQPGEDRPLEPGWALGAGAGIVQTDEAGETYLSANLRRRLGTRAERGEVVAPKDGLHAFVEGEVGYWKGETLTIKDKDLLVGVNLVGVVPTRVADLFMGIGFGVHFTDSEVLGVGALNTSETRFGGNAQFGVEVRATGKLGIFGAGRLDFLSGERNRQQNKIWGGLRVYF